MGRELLLAPGDERVLGSLVTGILEENGLDLLAVLGRSAHRRRTPVTGPNGSSGLLLSHASSDGHQVRQASENYLLGLADDARHNIRARVDVVDQTLDLAGPPHAALHVPVG